MIIKLKPDGSYSVVVDWHLANHVWPTEYDYIVEKAIEGATVCPICSKPIECEIKRIS